MRAHPSEPEVAGGDRPAVALSAAAAAAAELLALRSASPHLEGKELGKLGDRRSHALLVSSLSDAFAGDSILSEESADRPDRLASERVWIIDPLDGTREFGEPGRTDWAVHVALVERGELTLGVVALPALGVTYSSADPPSPPAPRGGRIRMTVSRTRPPELAAAVARALDAEMIPMGSAGAKAMSVLAGEHDIYLHAGGQYEWDSAAPVAVALAAGLHASRIDGSPLRYNRFPAWQPDLLVCRADLAGLVLAAIKEQDRSSNNA